MNEFPKSNIFNLKSKLLPLLVLGVSLVAQIQGVAQDTKKPNVIFILADDLGYGDLGCFGQEKIKTPNLDRMAAEGMKLTDFYAGATVCAPSRCVLMTGKHTGRCRVRGNAGSNIQRLHPEDKTVAAMFKNAGYSTGLFGKWGLGDDLDSTGHPNLHGFDAFYGYLSQYHAHNYYPTFLVRNKEIVKLRNVPDQENEKGAGWAKERIDYTHDLIVGEGMQWLEKNHDKPFFVYLPFTIPHANNEGTRGTGNGQEVPGLRHLRKGRLAGSRQGAGGDDHAHGSRCRHFISQTQGMGNR